MNRTRAVLTTIASLFLTVPLFALQPPAASGEYVPATPGTATEQLPAAPMLAAAYAFVWIAAMVYLWSVWRRLNKVEADMHALERKSRTSR
jgi:cation transport ATPase